MTTTLELSHTPSLAKSTLKCPETVKGLRIQGLALSLLKLTLHFLKLPLSSQLCETF